MSSSRRLRDYRHRILGKRAVLGAAAGATVGQLRNVPHEWGQGAGGFAKRFGSHLAQCAVKETIQLGVGAWHHEDLHYQRSNLHGTWPRMKYAVKSTFIVPRTNISPRTNRPGKTFALGRVSGNLGAGLISRAWQPASTAGIGAGLASSGIGLGADVGIHVAREFWPRKRGGKR
ncbi:conserved hypothetical protein [Candidatus Sulfopaludibacter sp. SbA4]|nr:conserved hypothetical protein [Candidatus Sulfopaludibacter sp. SbA4]